jgi:hypothetical protein
MRDYGGNGGGRTHWTAWPGTGLRGWRGRRGWRTFLTGETRPLPLKALYHNIVISRDQKSAAPIDALRLREMLR